MLWIVAACLSLAVIPLGVIAYGLLFKRPRTLTEAARDVLITAAHPDDCVIAGGEYALDAARAGRSIRILWLTCGAESPDEPRARLRKRETKRVWELLGLRSEDMHFLDLPQSGIDDRVARIGPEQAAGAQRSFEAIVRGLPENAAVLVPGKGEYHADHRVLREICLRGLRNVDRRDLLVLECVEYNSYYSLLRGPLRALSYVLGSMPIVGRRLASYIPARGAHPVDGDRALCLPPNPERLAQKRELLRMFESENGDLLVKLFGYADIYQRLDIADPEADHMPRGYVEIAGRHLGPSVLMLWSSLLGANFVLALALGARVIEDLNHGLVKLPIAVVGLALCLYARRMWRAQLERGLIYASAGSAILTSVAI